jgi:hypothetical protein
MATTTTTYQGFQSNLGHILDQLDSGEITAANLTKAAGGAVVAKVVPYATYAAADIANTAVLNYVAQLQLQHGPMDPATNGLYKLTKVADDAIAIGDTSVHASVHYVGHGTSGVDFVAVAPGVAGEAAQIAIVDPAGNNQALSVTVVGSAVTVHLATDGSGNLTSTFAEIANAVNASAAAAAIMTATAFGTTSLTPESTKATLQYTNGAGGLLFTADAAGAAGNAITVALVDPTVAGHAHYSYPDGVSGGNGIDFAAVATGVPGTPITITVVNPGVDGSISVAVVGSAITITLAYATGAVTSTLTNIKAAVDGFPAAAALVTATITGTASTLGTAMSIQTLTSDFAIGVSVSTTHITVNLATNTSGVITSTMTAIKAAVDGNGPAAALVDTVTTGTASTVAAALTQTALAGGADDGTLVLTSLAGDSGPPTTASRFRAYAIYRKRLHSRNALIAPTRPARAVLISKHHAEFLGL